MDFTLVYNPLAGPGVENLAQQFHILGHLPVRAFVRNALPVGVDETVAAADPEHQPAAGQLVNINRAHARNERAAAIGVEHIGAETHPLG